MTIPVARLAFCSVSRKPEIFISPIVAEIITAFTDRDRIFRRVFLASGWILALKPMLDTLFLRL